ncbi:deoxycytidylate deaminase [Natranaerofaba carboxydovora]|uniref:deoxycytidylate deaminase n=1 Tax=Natranaerofaba carboxydovora TaxID=2742683 RepID=UPI0024029CE7|nr:cytidine/deoxycytidylate deaminase family protein [Natranaerofaba carboxydovora]UMZ75116.1 Cytidine and deoxycytidylate deaminase zinc-binding region [Natranaerofaba carboxydovora]
MRPSWQDYFMEIAKTVKTRSTCLRRQVGSVLVRDKRILATGYNGAPQGICHCDKKGCKREELNIPSGERHEICRGLHAEQNAIIQAALHGVSTQGSVLYTTSQPCSLCAKMIINADIKRVVFDGYYPDELSAEILNEADVELILYSK